MPWRLTLLLSIFFLLNLSLPFSSGNVLGDVTGSSIPVTVSASIVTCPELIIPPQPQKPVCFTPFFFIPLFLLLLLLLCYLFTLFKNSQQKNLTTIGLVYNSLTLEPLSGIKVHVDHQTLTSNIFGLIAAKLPLKDFSVSINNPDYHFEKPITDFPYYNLPLAPYKIKTIAYKLHQFFLPKPGTILKNNQPEVGLKLGLIETRYNTLVTSRISDSLGHYRFIVPHGHYNLIIFDTNKVLKTYNTRHLVNGYTTINEDIVI